MRRPTSGARSQTRGMYVEAKTMINTAYHYTVAELEKSEAARLRAEEAERHAQQSIESQRALTAA